MADFPPADLQGGPPPDLITPPPDLVGADQPSSLADANVSRETSSGLGAFGRSAERGTVPAVGGLGGAVAGGGLGLMAGAATGPAAPIAAPVLGFVGGLGGAYLGSEGVQRVQDWAISKLPGHTQKVLGLDKAQQQADVTQHPYLSFAGELAPNLAFLRPGKIASAVPEGAGLVRRAIQSPAAARVAGATVMAGQEAGTEKYQTGKIDPAKVAMAAGAGALMNKPTWAGEKVIAAASAAQRVLTNIARGRPADAPDPAAASGHPPDDLVDAPAGATAPAAKPPSAAPAQGEAIGMRFKAGPPKRATVDHYFDNGNAVRLRMDDGSVQDFTTADMLKNRTAAPEPMQPQDQAPANTRQLTPDERPVPPFDLMDQEDVGPTPARRPPSQAPLGGDLLNTLDHADRLEKAALNQSYQLSGGARQDMLAEAARLRRMVGQPGESGTPPNAYRHPLAGQERVGDLPIGQGSDYAHPLAGEPAADLGELAHARAANPGAYQGDYGRTVPEGPDTLKAQQEQLLNGRRPAMLFPSGPEAAAELPLPQGMARTVTPDGIFHFDPTQTSAEAIATASQGQELNHLLALGPYSKTEVMRRIAAGEQPLAVTERAPDGTEVRTAAGTDQTAAEQRDYFERSKTPGNTVKIETPADVVAGRKRANVVDPYALADVTRARAPMPKEPTLFDAIRQLGGIKDDRGDVAQIMQGYKNPPFKRRVFNPESGMAPDDVRKALQEQGWFGRFDNQFGPEAQETGSYPGDDIKDLYDMMDREARGTAQYHPESGTHAELADRQYLDQEMTEAGVSANDPPQIAARKLAEYRKSRDADHLAHEAVRSAHEDIQDISPQALEELQGHGYEPGSDIGAEFEEFGGHEENAEQPQGEPPRPDEDHGRGEQAPGGGEGAAEGNPAERGDVGAGVESFRTTPGAIAAEHAAEVSRLEAEGTVAAASALRPNAEPGAEGFDQTIIPGTEQSARQLAEAREAQGRGRMSSQAGQRPADEGLFGEKPPPDLFGGVQQPDDALKSPPFYSALTRGVEGLKFEKAKPSQWEATIKNLPGIKQEELDWSGVNDWLRSQTKAVTKAELLDHLRQNEVQVQEVGKGVPRKPSGGDINAVVQWAQENVPHKRDVIDSAAMAAATGNKDGLRFLQEADVPARLLFPFEEQFLFPGDNAKFASYVLPGGENYRELLLTLPHKYPEKLGDYRKPYTSSHWDEPNVLAHVRFDDRAGPNGEKVLHVAEIQSDWHQKGRRSGYMLPEARRAELDARRAELEKIGGDLRGEGKEIPPEVKTEWAAVMNELQPHNAGKVPDAPFKTTWQELAAKRMLRYAAEHGYDRLSWDTGETQAARYDLSKQVDAVTAEAVEEEPGVHFVDIHPRSGGPINLEVENGKVRSDGDYEGKDLADVIGKDLAVKILAMPLGERKQYTGIDLKVGGHGMKGFYDRILPNFLNKYAKKWGAKVETAPMHGGMPETRRGDYQVTQDSQGKWVAYRPGDQHDFKEFGTEAEARRFATGRDTGPLAHSIPITPAMRESVMQGQPLFQPGAEAAAGAVTPLDADLSTWLARNTPPDLSQGARNYLLERQAATGHEALVFHDANGDALSHAATQNLPGQVNFTPEMRQRLSDPSANIVLHHNHPSDRSLSAHDIGALAFPGLHAIVAHTAEGNWYGASLSPAWRRGVLSAVANEGDAGIARMHGLILKTVQSVDDAIIPSFQKLIDTRALTNAEAEKAVHHVANAILADRGVIDYKSSQETSDESTQIARAFGGNRGFRSPGPVRFDRGIADILGNIRPPEPDRVGSGRGTEGEEDAGPKGVEQPQSRFPSGLDEAGDRLDRAADAMAEQLRGAPPGTYARTLHRISPPMGDLIFKDPNAVQNVTLRPETLARLDTRSAAIWNAEKAKEYEANTMVDDLRQRISGTMLKLDDAGRNKVYAARELDRINGITREDTGHQIVARNDGSDFAHLSKPGDVVTLSPEETAAYHGLTDMFDRAWKNIMEGAARKVGWQGAWDKDDMSANIEALKQKSETTADRGTAKTALRAAKIVSTLDEQRRQGYHPLMRFGDYYAHVTPKIGTDMSSTGGFPKTLRFELAERGLMDDIVGGKRVGNQAPPYAKEMLDRIKAQYPADKFDVEHGYLAHRPGILDRVDIPAIEKLMTFMENDMLHGLRQEGRGRGMSKEDASSYARDKYDDLYGHLVDQLWEKTFKELEAGFRKKSHTTPGYSDDFDRALGTYMHWTSRNVADQIHRSTIDDAHTAMETDPSVNPRVKRYWKNWRDYQHSPSNIFNKAVNGMARWGFLTSMGVNPSSTAVVGTHGLFMAGPTLSVGVGMGHAAPAYFKALGHAMAAIKVDTSGLHIDDVARAGRTPTERAFLVKLDQEGTLHSRAIQDMAALNEKQSSLWGSARSSARKVMDAALSNVSVMDRANRIASALSSYRLASDPKTLAKMDAAWQQNQIWRDHAAREGVTPETMARFMVPNMVGEYGHMNQAPIERNAASRMLLGMHGFVTRLLQNMWKLGSMGPEGQKALLWTMGAFWVMAGTNGMPFSQDVQNAADLIWKTATGKDPMLGYRIQSALASTFGKPGANMILNGPVSSLTGANVSGRLGLGDLITRNWPTAENTLGAYPAIILGRAIAAISNVRSGQYEAAAAQALPGGLHAAAMAAIERQHGIKTRAGKVEVPRTKITPVETTARALGFTPEKAELAYERGDYDYRASRAKMRPPPNPVPTYADGGHVHAAANEADPEPSAAQIESGNYKKGHLSLHGFDITIETAKGTARRGVGADGKPWENRHKTAHYGYIRRTSGADGEHVDCYIGAHPQSERVFVVDQFDPKTRAFDEHKIVFGARTMKEAKAVYDGGFSDASGPRRRRHVHEVSPQTLRAWLGGSDTAQPFAEAA